LDDDLRGDVLNVHKADEKVLHAASTPFAQRGALFHLREMFGALKQSEERRPLILLALGLAVVIAFTTLGQIGLNAWNKPFYDAIARKDLAGFGRQLVTFAWLVVALLILNVSQTWLQGTLKVTLREAVTRDLVRNWLEPGRPFRLAREGGDVGVNPDQRMHEDARRLTELTGDLGVGLFLASLSLVSFVGVLWNLSSAVSFDIAGRSVTIPGYMVWCALAYSATGTWLSWLVGRPLIHLDAERYAREANFRFSLVRASENADQIALYGGETFERRGMNADINRVLAAMHAVVKRMTMLSVVTSGYGWFAIVAPLIVAAPGYFGGELSFGDLMMVVGAFFQVQQSLRWFVDNMANVADWQATLTRVATFRETLSAQDAPADPDERIIFASHPLRALSFNDLEVTYGGGRSRLCEPHVEVRPGEHVLIVGDPGAGKSALYLALAGLWNWGSGMVRLPPRQGMVFLSQSSYLPIGELRAAVTYPSSPDRFEAFAIRDAMELAGLDYLVPQLERSERWDKALSHEEQQRVVLARMLLRKPNWIVLDAATDGLNIERRRMIQSLISTHLPRASVVAFSREPHDETFYKRVVRLERITSPVVETDESEAAAPRI
jgi:putative ATP-binding cassette transporter